MPKEVKDKRANGLLNKEDFAAGIARLHLPVVSTLKAKNSSGEGDKMG